MTEYYMFAEERKEGIIWPVKYDKNRKCLPLTKASKQRFSGLYTEVHQFHFIPFIIGWVQHHDRNPTAFINIQWYSNPSIHCLAVHINIPISLAFIISHNFVCTHCLLIDAILYAMKSLCSTLGISLDTEN